MTTATTRPHVTVLADRGVVSVTGADAEKLLGGLITNDIALIAEAHALYAALLAPQGKMLFDFLVVKRGDGFLLDTLREKTGDLVKRLSMYKLRAQAEIRDVSADFAVGAAWGGETVPSDVPAGALVYADPRLPALGSRFIADVTAVRDAGDAVNASPEAYEAHRIGLGVPEGGRDFVFGDTFPHEALLDQLNGVSFDKGCYVGQEVVSRMQHRTTVRKRVVPVEADQELPQGPLPVLVGEAEIGRLGSVAGQRGLALLRLDRVAEAQRGGTLVTVNGLPLRVVLPSFATFQLGAPHEIA